MPITTRERAWLIELIRQAREKIDKIETGVLETPGEEPATSKAATNEQRDRKRV